MATPWLEDFEVDNLCQGLSQPAAMVRFLKGKKLTVETKPNGRPLVLRSNVESVLGGMPPTQDAMNDIARQPVQPNRAGLILQFARKGA